MPRGIGLSVPLALLRGHVMVFVPSLLNLGELLITGNGWFVVVRIRLARKFYASIREIETEFGEAITGLRLVPRRDPVSCELWLYSRYGTLRHFRVDDVGLVEIDCYGTPLGQVRPTLTGSHGNRDDAPAHYERIATGPAAPGSADTRTPILRWLAKKNAAGKSIAGSDSVIGLDLKRILDAGRPGGKVKQASCKKLAGTRSESPGPPAPGIGRNGDKPDPGVSRDNGEELDSQIPGSKTGVT